MKRFLVFAGDTWYAAGGIADLVNSTETLEEAQASMQIVDDGVHTPEITINDTIYEWYQIYDVETCAIIEQAGKAYS